MSKIMILMLMVVSLTGCVTMPTVTEKVYKPDSVTVRVEPNSSMKDVQAKANEFCGSEAMVKEHKTIIVGYRGFDGMAKYDSDSRITTDTPIKVEQFSFDCK